MIFIIIFMIIKWACCPLDIHNWPEGFMAVRVQLELSRVWWWMWAFMLPHFLYLTLGRARERDTHRGGGWFLIRRHGKAGEGELQKKTSVERGRQRAGELHWPTHTRLPADCWHCWLAHSLKPVTSKYWSSKASTSRSPQTSWVNRYASLTFPHYL